MNKLSTADLNFKEIPFPSRLLLTSFLLFVFLGIVQNYNDVYRACFFVGMLPAAWLLLVKEKVWAQIKHSTLLWLVIILLTSLYLSVYWSETDNYSRTAIRHTRWYLWTTIFFVSMFTYGYLGLHRSKYHGAALQATVILGTTIALVLYVTDGRFPARITGQGLLDVIIMSSSLLVIIWVVSLSGLNLNKKRDIVIATIGLLLVTIYVILNQSRAPLGATLLAWAFFLFYIIKPVRIRIALVCTVLALGFFLVWYFELITLFEKMYARGGSHRLTIWQATLSQVQDFAWFGYGVATSIKITPVGDAIEAVMNQQFNHSHNIFLTTWVLGGILPSLLLFVVFSMLTWLSLRAKQTISLLTILTLWALCSTDTFKIISSPQEIWILLWMPIGILCGSLMRDHQLEEQHP